MSDPRLCSIHLETLPRRQEYRRAREQLLNACGQQTLAIDQAQFAALRSGLAPPPESPAGQTATKFWLVDRDAFYPLKVGLNTIGRMPDNDVAVLDGSVSRRHCAVVVHATRGCELYDTASKNGTFLNGERVSAPTPLKPGDQIRLCERQFIFVAGDPAAAPLLADADDDPNGRTQVE
jgi:hypothetical protein